MSDYLIDTVPFSADDPLIQVESLPLDAIALRDDQIDQARALSQRVPEPGNRWQAYLNALALLGFETWLHQRSPDMPFNSHHSKMVQSSSESDATTIFNVIANNFKLCLIGIGSILDAEITIPTATIDQVDCTSHFYVPIEVYEELGAVSIAGFLSYVQLSHYQRTDGFKVAPNQTYRLPFAWFETDANRLLLQLNCLSPTAISLPAATSPKPLLHPMPLQQVFLEPVVNVGRWMQNQWQGCAQNADWLLLPSLQLASELRSLTPSFKMRSRSIPEEFKSLLKDLASHNVLVSEDAGSAYREFILGDSPLRLYAVITQLNTPGASPEWSLLLILKTQDDTKLPAKIQLQVSDLNHGIVAQLTNQQPDTGYLFTRVIGCHHEQFLVTLSLPTGESLTLPPFAFSC